MDNCCFVREAGSESLAERKRNDLVMSEDRLLYVIEGTSSVVPMMCKDGSVHGSL